MTDKTVVMHVVNSLSLSGAERLVVQLVKGMNRDKYDITVCSIVPGNAENEALIKRELVDAGIQVIQISKSPNGERIRTIKTLHRLMRDMHVDIVHTHCPSPDFYGTIAGSLAKIPVRVSTIHNTAGYSRKFISVLRRMTTRYIAISDSVMEYAHSNLGIPSNKLDIIHNGVQEPQFTNALDFDVRTELGLSKETRIITVVARVVQQKGLTYLVDSAPCILKEFPHAHFLIVGDTTLDPKYATQLKGLIREMALEPYFTFMGVRPDALAIIKSSDIVVMPSLWEGLPLVALETLAIGTPFVSTDVGAIREVIDHGVHGLIVPPTDSQALARAVLKVLQNQDLKDSLTSAGKRRFAEKYIISKTIDLYEQFYARLIKERSL